MAHFASPERKRFREDRSLRLDECPRAIDVTEFVEARALEITQLLAVVDNANLPAGEVAQGPRTFVQRLPRHLRRRAMSYNIKRLPRRLRNMAGSTIKESKHRKKPPSRRWRRRPRNLLNAYIRRQRRLKWLETHIWHAKRFQMMEYCGWRLAYKSCQRGFRASYRDVIGHCVVQDLSYYTCFELIGPEKILIDRLNTLCQRNVSQTFSNVKVLTGSVEGRAILYEPGSYPLNCIGYVHFMYRPRMVGDENRTLWIWVHPTLETRLLDILVQILGLQQLDSEKQEDSLDKIQNVDQFHLARALESPTYRSISASITLIILKHDLIRFRLTGPKSASVLNRVLHQPSNDQYPEIFNSSKEISGKQWHLWKDIYGRVDVGRVDPGLIISLTVMDPRLFTEYKKRIPDDPVGNMLKALPKAESDLSICPIWSKEVRQYTLDSKLSDAVLNDMRRKGTISKLKSGPSNVIPILLVQHCPPNCTNHIGLGSGWDLILPAGWAMPFWIAVQYATARAVGLEFQRHFSMESSDQYLAYPQFWPDTESGRKFQENEADALKNRYIRRPVNRRVDYERLRITHPFSCPWLELVNGWMRVMSQMESVTESDQFYALRDRISLKKLQEIFHDRISGKKLSIDFLISLSNQHPRALIPIRLSSIGKGIPKSRSLICLPTKEDLQKLAASKTLNELESTATAEPKAAQKVEPAVEKGFTEMDFIKFNVECKNEIELDLNEMFRDNKEKRLMERKKKDKERKKKKRDQNATGSKLDIDRAKVAEYENIVDSCQRRILGYVVDGDFSLANGRGQALGYCSLLALKNYLQVSQNLMVNSQFIVLYRNVQSRYYRAAVLSIMT